MAKRTLIIDDLTGDTGARTRHLRIDGVDYEIDLTDSSYAELRRALKPYLRAARTSGSTGGKPGRRPARATAGGSRSRTSRAPRASRSAPTEAAVIRAWARSVGMAVTERGRVAPDVRAAWQAAGSPR